jgi:hypothetical protein
LAERQFAIYLANAEKYNFITSGTSLENFSFGTNVANYLSSHEFSACGQAQSCHTIRVFFFTEESSMME